jgi:hypothetical protein
MNCKCYVYVDPDPKKTRIVHCPIHEAAPAMLEALQQFVRLATNGKHPQWNRYLDTGAGAKMKAAIAKAEQPFERDITKGA